MDDDWPPINAKSSRPKESGDDIGRVTKPFVEMGFFETELARITECFGQIVHAAEKPGPRVPCANVVCADSTVE